MSSSTRQLEMLVHLRQARDAMDRDYAQPLDVATVAQHAHMSPAHFSRQFKVAYGETPNDYLMSRRVERAMTLLREGSSVTDACLAVGYTSVGSFVDRFTALTGDTPSGYRARDHGHLDALPPCVVRTLSRPSGRRGPRDVEDRAGSEKRARCVRPTVRA